MSQTLALNQRTLFQRSIPYRNPTRLLFDTSDLILSIRQSSMYRYPTRHSFWLRRKKLVLSSSLKADANIQLVANLDIGFPTRKTGACIEFVMLWQTFPARRPSKAQCHPRHAKPARGRPSAHRLPQAVTSCRACDMNEVQQWRRAVSSPYSCEMLS